MAKPAPHAVGTSPRAQQQYNVNMIMIRGLQWKAFLPRFFSGKVRGEGSSHSIFNMPYGEVSSEKDHRHS